MNRTYSSYLLDEFSSTGILIPEELRFLYILSSSGFKGTSLWAASQHLREICSHFVA